MNMYSVPCHERGSRQKSKNPSNEHHPLANLMPQTPVIWKLCISGFPERPIVPGITLYSAESDQVFVKSLE